MKRAYSTTNPSSSQGNVEARSGVSVLISANDENSAPNHQPKSIALSSTLLPIKPASLPIANHVDPFPSADPKAAIAKNTRVAIKRHALGDLSNLNTSAAVHVTSHLNVPTRNLRSRAVPVKKVNEESSISFTQARVSTQTPSSPLIDWDDLDAEDVGDPAMVRDYVDDIFPYLYDLEKKLMADPNYMVHQNEITWKMRSVLIDWLVEVHWKLKLLPETLFLTVNLIDRFLSIRSVSLAKFQLVGITATFIASKYEENLAPSVRNFVHLSDGTYDEQEILKAESYMLTSLQFVLGAPTPYVFLRRVSKADQYDVQTRTLAKYFLEVSLLDPVFLKYTPSQFAAASIFLARKMLNKGDWDANLRHYSNWDVPQLIPVARDLIEYFQKPLKYEAIFKKYMQKTFKKASLFVKDYIEKYYPVTPGSQTAPSN